MEQFFDTLLLYLDKIVDFLVKVFEGFATLIGRIPDALSLGPYLDDMVPPLIGANIAVVISIYIAKFFLGR